MEIKRTRGDSYPDRFLITNLSTNEPANLTGCVIKMTVSKDKAPIDNANQVYQLVGQVSDPTSGIVLFAPTEQQADLSGIYYFDLELTDSYGLKYTLVKDAISFEQDITK
jgi:hypothetical protein